MTVKTDSIRTIDLPLRGTRLGLARFAWFTLVAIMLGVTVYGYPEYVRKLSSLDFTSTTLVMDWTPAALTTALSGLDLAPGYLAGYLILVDVLQILSFLLVGGLIFWRKSNTWLGLFASYVLIGIGSTIGGGSETLSIIASPLKEVIIFTTALVWPALFIFLFLFPDGRFTPRWTRLFVPLWGLFYLWYAVSDLILKLGFDTFKTFGLLFMILSVGAALFSQVYRYFKVSGSVERQQTKWFLLAIALVFIWSSGDNFFFSPFLRASGFPPTQTLLFDMAWQPVGFFALAAMPVSIAIALFRYHLWDIDVIIRKTLIYSAVTATLALVYFGGVVLLQEVFSGLGARQSSAALVLSTLAIAALFSPLRRRVQEAVDRRFYRPKYDAQRTVQAFAASLRTEVDIDELGQHFLSVVQKTVRPRDLSLWVGDTGHNKKLIGEPGSLSNEQELIP